jgi:mannose-6-phosphate isomerase
MLNALHRINVEPGDVYFVAAGVPHAIGEGVFMIEVQEPSDWFVLAEYKSFGMKEEDAHQGRGWKLGFDCFDFTTYPTREDVQAAFKQTTPVVREEAESYERQLISPEYAEFFGASDCVVRGSLSMPGGTFYIGIVETGSGYVETNTYQLRLKRGTTFVVPASVSDHQFVSGEETELVITVCYPPHCS